MYVCTCVCILYMWYVRTHVHSFIHSFILETYIAPLQETTTQRRSQPSHGQKRTSERCKIWKGGPSARNAAQRVVGPSAWTHNRKALRCIIAKRARRTRTHVCKYLCMYECVYVCMYACMCVCMYLLLRNRKASVITAVDIISLDLSGIQSIKIIVGCRIYSALMIVKGPS